MQVSDDFIFWLKFLNALTIFWLVIYVSDIIDYKTEIFSYAKNRKEVQLEKV